MVAFWGCEVTETKSAVVSVPKGFVLNVVNATCSAATADVHATLSLETKQLDGKLWKGAVAHLGAQQPSQVKLDLVFGHDVKFHLTKGPIVVNLSGYFQPGPSAEVVENNKASTPSIAPNKNKKRVRDDKKETPKTQEKAAPSSNGSVKVQEKTAKTAKRKASASDAKKDEQEKAAETQADDSASQKKKRKKNKGKKVGATN